jgi:asparagine synthase (glutamine-hydrolysing)
MREAAMCGIAGLWSPAPVDRALVHAMTAALAHRGPDGEGFDFDDEVGLGHRRLSIIDLATGSQPMSSDDGMLSLVFNGEIYNFPELRRELEAEGHRFRTRSDTEVILHLYQDVGAGVVTRLRGMFAFAIWDRRRRRLFLARDHIGQKPLFYSATNGRFAFASEIKALLQPGLVSASLDLVGLSHLMSVRFIPGTGTLFHDVEKLPAGHWMVVEEGRVTLERYWEPRYEPKMSASEEEIVDGLRGRLVETVRALLISDVPVGAFLSGGLDSSTVASIMARVAPTRLRAFSIGVAEADFNELPYARLVAERYGIEHHEEIVRPDVVTLLPRLVRHMDEPVDPFGFGVYFAARLAARHVKVVMGGDGGDELFVGYDRYVGHRLLDLYGSLPPWLRQGLIARLTRLVPDSYSYNSLALKLRWLDELSHTSGGARYAESLAFLRFTRDAKSRLFSSSARRELDGALDSSAAVLRHFDCDSAADAVDRMLYTDLVTRMPDNLLLTVDHMTMAHGLEDRSPLLDHGLAEFVATIPGAMKLSGRRLKHLLRRAAADLLPAPLLSRRKQGFSFPLASWIKGPLGGLLERFLQSSRLADAGYFARPYMLELLAQHRAGRLDHNYRLWFLLNLEIWWRLYIDGTSLEALVESVREAAPAIVAPRGPTLTHARTEAL